MEGIGSLAERDTPALSNAIDALRPRPHNIGYSDGSIQRITRAARWSARQSLHGWSRGHPGDGGQPVSHLHQAIAATDDPVVVVLEDCEFLPERAPSSARSTAA